MPAPARLPLRHVALALAVAMAGAAAHAGGLDIHADADAKDIGLPAYPGAVKKADKGDDPAGFSFGVWGQSFGFKLAAVSYRSSDDVDAVAAFYRDAMGRYGPVLDCSHNHKHKGGAAASAAGDGKSTRNLPVECEDDKPEAGGRLFKVGTVGAHREFRVHPVDGGVSFVLVLLEMRGAD
jgi:hypothetical protein